jgi:hypothetical protein
MTSWLDSGNLQYLFKVVRNKVANSQTDVFEGPIHDQILHDGP